MGIRTAATALLLLLLLVASACHADTGRPVPAVRPLRPSRPSRPSKPPRSQAAPDVSNGNGRRNPSGAADEPLLAPMEAIVAPAPSMPPMPPVERPTAGPTDAVRTPAPPMPPADQPVEEGDLRLAARVDVNGYATGALQVFLDGAFGAVCSFTFGPADADVACRQMGFTGGTSLPLALLDVPSLRSDVSLQDVVAPFVLENLDCAGTEESLMDCPGVMEERPSNGAPADTYSYADRAGLTRCRPTQSGYAFVACGMTEGPGRGDLRLARGATSEDGNAQFGRLEIFDHGGWGSVCEAVLRNQPVRNRRGGSNMPLTDAAVNVACRQLGFEGGAKTQIPVNPEIRELRRIPFLLAGANCTGDEAALAECPGGSGLGGSTLTCGAKDVLSISCSSSPDPEMEGRLRLMESTAGAGFEYGRLEIFLRGFWSNICDTESFTPDSAQVACSILGYDGGVPLKIFPAIGLGGANQVLVAPLPVGLASVDCDGTEASLLQCTSSQIDLRNCAIRGTNLTDATVLACGSTAAGCPDPAAVEGGVRLRGGFGTPCDALHSGFVEVFHLGEWGAICDNQGSAVASVVCRQLGFPYGSIVDSKINPPDPDFSGEYTGPYNQPTEAEEPVDRFWLENARCNGREPGLTECDLGGGFMDGIEGCRRGFAPTLFDVRLSVACRTFPVLEALEGVTTPGAEEGDVRLVGQTSVANWRVGSLEVFFEGAWGHVCTGGFDDAAVSVACRQLGFSAGTVVAGGIDSAAPREGAQLVFPSAVLSRPGCTGTEASLLDCPGEPEFVLRSLCFSRADDSEGLMVACVADLQAGEEGAVRLIEADASIDDPAAGVGVLEIFHAGAWGTVCDGDDMPFSGGASSVTTASARVACRQLSFESGGVFRQVRSVPANVTLLPPWLARLPCDAQEATLLDCDGFAFGRTFRCEFMQRLFCNTGETRLLTPRLVGGRADSAGAWEYGRLQVFDGAVFSTLDGGLGRSGIELACRTLGYATGAQLLGGPALGLPAVEATPVTLRSIMCAGDAATLIDCTAERARPSSFDSDAEREGIAALCFNPSGCTVDDTPPAQGDLRLVNPRNSDFMTQPCDDVHFGAIEFFNEGRWGRICADSGDRESPTVEATVMCRQLGFPFGSLIGLREVRDQSGRTASADDYIEYGEPEELVWEENVLCTGLEERLEECAFPGRFGNPPGVSGTPDLPSPGLSPSICGRRDGLLLGLACRRFEVEESDTIRRL